MRNDITIDTTIRRAGFDDLAGAAGVLATAFQDDPVFSWCVPDATRRAALLPSFFRIIANAIAVHDDIHVAAVSSRPVSGAIDGAAMWLPPDAAPVGDLEAPFAELFGDDAGRTFDIVGLLEAAHPHAPHHYLWFVGVAPDAQGRGIGSTLLRDGGTGPAYLEATSKDNRRLYERHGFEVVNELRVGSSPTLWAMWRESEAATLDG
jgi:ribosomal protein S18 acetylase RimI-like enzyme